MEQKILDKVGRYEFLSEPFHCDFSSHLFMGHLGNHLLNAADFHSNDRGFGMNYLMPRHKTWVLSRLAIGDDRDAEVLRPLCSRNLVRECHEIFHIPRFQNLRQDIIIRRSQGLRLRQERVGND